MALQKKHGKGRLDKWYKLAKEKGYRARAAFKLIQLNKKYHFLERSKVLIDLCAAPGSWCQVAAEAMPVNSIIIGVDLVPIKAIPRVITLQGDITTDKCRASIAQQLKTWKADTVLHDGAPNVGTAWVQDAFTQAELVLKSLKLATSFLMEGGTFVTKVFRSKDYNSLLWVFNQLFEKVEATKPPSSRSVSAEIFVVCRGFKAPKRIDPRFLDSRSVFAELAGPTPNNEAKVFKPEVKKRKREGYEEGDYTQFKEAPVSSFIETADPIAMLGTLNRLSFYQAKNGDVALAAIDKLPETTLEVRKCCEDLKVLGRRDFKTLLKWRLLVREKFGFGGKKTEIQPDDAEEVTEITPMDEELRMQEDLQRLRDQESARKKRERRRENERKQKEIVRMQLHMTAPMDIGLEQTGPDGTDALFSLKAVDKAGAVQKVAKGKMGVIVEADSKKEADNNDDNRSDASITVDDDGDELEGELDELYEQYKARRSEADTKYRAKMARREHGDDEWHGFSAASSSDEDTLLEDSDESDMEDTEGGGKDTIMTTFESERGSKSGLSKRAEMFFEQGIFKDLGPLRKEEESQQPLAANLEKTDGTTGIKGGSTVTDKSRSRPKGSASHAKNGDLTSRDGPKRDSVEEEDGEEESEPEAAPGPQNNHHDWDNDDEEPVKDGRPDIDIITAEAMTLAQQIASGATTRQQIMDDGFNKYSFRDTDGLPEWFLDDEAKHSKPHRPITAAAAAAIKEKMRALNARPIKKVREAKERKKYKIAQRLEKLRKKSALMADDENMTEQEKAHNIAKLMSKAAKRKPKQQVKVVVAKHANRGIAGRPRGVKGKYKIVDARLKKDVRAQKRLAKKQR